jgi:hypothetical protein
VARGEVEVGLQDPTRTCSWETAEHEEVWAERLPCDRHRLPCRPRHCPHPLDPENRGAWTLPRHVFRGTRPPCFSFNVRNQLPTPDQMNSRSGYHTRSIRGGASATSSTPSLHIHFPAVPLDEGARLRPRLVALPRSAVADGVRHIWGHIFALKHIAANPLTVESHCTTSILSAHT